MSELDFIYNSLTCKENSFSRLKIFIRNRKRSLSPLSFNSIDDAILFLSDRLSLSDIERNDKSIIKLSLKYIEQVGHTSKRQYNLDCFQKFISYLSLTCKQNPSFVLIDCIQKYLLIFIKEFKNSNESIVRDTAIIVISTLVESLMSLSPKSFERKLPEEFSLISNYSFKKKKVRMKPKVLILAGKTSSTAKLLSDRIQKNDQIRLSTAVFNNDAYSKKYPTFNSAFYPDSHFPKKILNKSSNTVNNSISYFNSPKNEIFIDYLEKNKPDIGIIAGCPILPKEVINKFSVGIINSHNGILPNVRGMDSVAWSLLLYGKSGGTLHFVDKNIDSGNIISRFYHDGQNDKNSVKEKIIDSILSAINFYVENHFLPEGVKQEQYFPIYFQMGGLLRSYLSSKMQ